MKTILIAFVIGLSAVSAMAAQTYDVTTDYQTSSNGSGVWSYGYSPQGGTDYRFVKFDTSNDAAWYLNGYQILGTPATWINKSSGTLYGVGPGQLSLHPGPVQWGDFTIVRFTAPTAGTYKITGQFFAGDTGAMDGVVILDGKILTPLQYFSETTNDSVFNIHPLSLASGATIDFAVGNRGSFYSGNTPLSASIQVTPVPEPESFAMLMAGLGLIAGAVSRRKKAVAVQAL